jgi:hypothetical protein
MRDACFPAVARARYRASVGARRTRRGDSAGGLLAPHFGLEGGAPQRRLARGMRRNGGFARRAGSKGVLARCRRVLLAPRSFARLRAHDSGVCGGSVRSRRLRGSERN